MGAGQSQNKDGYIDMIVDIYQQVTMAGDFVQGVVHINCKDKRPYKLLQLRLEGKQHVYWTEQHQSGKNTRTVTYRNSRNTYNYAFDLAVFSNGIIGGGHYSFPFKFLLPSGFPGSYRESDRNYIRYPITAELIPSSSQQDEIQKFSRFLNVQEPVRKPPGQLIKELVSNPKCCHCCMDYGMVKIGIACDKNMVRTGQSLSVSCYIDNSAGTKQISDITVKLEENRLLLSSCHRTRHNKFSENILFASPKVVQPGQNQEIMFTGTIPSNLVRSTAIGSIISLYYILQLETSMGCCANNPEGKLHLVVNSSNPRVQEFEQIPPPPGWNPIVTGEVVHTNMRQYTYNPDSRITVRNREVANDDLSENEIMMNNGGMMNQQQLYPMNQQQAYSTMDNMNQQNVSGYPPNQQPFGY